MAYNSSIQSLLVNLIYLMFGRQTQYLWTSYTDRPTEQQVQSYEEYATLLQNRLQTAF